MAQHLLTGGKMLSELCPVCGAPLFNIKGVKKCVVCEETKKDQPETAPHLPASVPENLRVLVPKYAQDDIRPANSLTEEMDALILSFSARAKGEPDPARCLTLMECIRTAAEAKTILTRFK
ncbi:MAG: autoantigen p27 domain-containing protein [Methanocorpusculum sp.]|nr:autoantigen p27 domain-containing protein [Methanocorpusculum sp.]